MQFVRNLVGEPVSLPTCNLSDGFTELASRWLNQWPEFWPHTLTIRLLADEQDIANEMRELEKLLRLKRLKIGEERSPYDLSAKFQSTSDKCEALKSSIENLQENIVLGLDATVEDVILQLRELNHDNKIRIPHDTIIQLPPTHNTRKVGFLMEPSQAGRLMKELAFSKCTLQAYSNITDYLYITGVAKTLTDTQVFNNPSLAA